MRHKLKVVLISGLLVFVTAFNSLSVSAATKLYNEVKTSTVTKGVDYIYDHRLTDAGFQDVHVLKIDMDADNIKLAPVESISEYGKKETVLKMVNDNGALAGVNADFFGMAGNYSASFGPVIKDGELISAGTDRNLTSNEYSSFILKEDGNAFLQYFKFDIDFFADGKEYFELASVNKITEMKYPIYYDRNAANNTKDLDARFSGLVKIVVEDDVITYISQKGETVDVPEDGYLIILSSSYADSYVGQIQVGQEANVVVNASVDIPTVEMAIGGGGTILVNGNKASDPGLVIAGRQPRTALGISQDQKTLILMVVDGRGTSIGATHDEMVSLMKEYGAYNAMHLDGGGSSTMVAKESHEDAVSVKNKVSDGSERKVMNGIGIFDTAEVSEMTSLVLKPNQERIFVGDTITFDVFGYDEYYHKINVPSTDVTFSAQTGSFTNNIFKPTEPGKVTIYAGYDDIKGTTEVEVMEMASIKPNISELNLSKGQSATLSVSGLSTEGFSGAIKGEVKYSLSDESLGTLNGNVFTAGDKSATGYIKCSANGLDCYIRVAIGGEEKGISSFDNVDGKITFTSYPNDITGSVANVNTEVTNGTKSMELKYNFKESKSTQAAYLNLSEPAVINDPATEIKLSIFGNNSGDWVRGKLIDAEGKSVVIDFTKDMNWEGWKDVTAYVPADTKFPAKLETIYVASLSNTDTAERKIYIDYLRAVVPMENNDEIPADTKIPDVYRGSITEKTSDGYYINIIGRVSSGEVKDKDLYEKERNNLSETVGQNTDLAIFAGSNDISKNPSVETIKWSSTYGFYSKDNVDIVQLTATNGGLRKTFAAQWSTFKKDIMNSNNKNVIFIMNRTPSDFTDQMEAQLFRNALNDIRESGKTVFVVSASGYGAWETVKDGIRYINLPDLWYKGNVNRNYSMAKFKITDDNITYDIERLYK